jgi:hypothetical protein
MMVMTFLEMKIKLRQYFRLALPKLGEVKEQSTGGG